MPEYTQLKGITQIGDSSLCEQLRTNIIEFFNWGLLGVGAFRNVTLTTSGAYGSNYSSLSGISDPNFSSGQVWQAPFRNWVWETGVEYATQPIDISGVYINDGTNWEGSEYLWESGVEPWEETGGYFYPKTTTGIYAHYYNYHLGRVVFNSGIPASSTVHVEYSFRYCGFHDAEEPRFREVYYNVYRAAEPASGHASARHRLQLPAVGVEIPKRREIYGYQLGGGTVHLQDVLFHVVAESQVGMDKMVDVLCGQKDKTIHLFDLTEMRASGVFPLDKNGSRVSGALVYPDLVSESGYRWRKCTFNDMKAQEFSRPKGEEFPLYRAIVRATVEVVLP